MQDMGRRGVVFFLDVFQPVNMGQSRKFARNRHHLNKFDLKTGPPTKERTGPPA